MLRLCMVSTFCCVLAFSPLAIGQSTPAPAPAAMVGPNNSPSPTAAAPAAPPSPTAAMPDANGRYTLRDGEDVPLKFDQDISSKTAADGDPVIFVLAEDLKVGNVVVAKAGTKAHGEVTNAKKSGMMGKGGELNIRLDYLKVGDTKVHLRGTKGKEGDSATGSTVALTVLFGPIGLIKHGHNIDIKQGAPLTAYVADDVALLPITATP